MDIEWIGGGHDVKAGVPKPLGHFSLKDAKLL